MGIIRFSIRRTKIILVGKYRYSKKEKENLLNKFTYWKDWRISIWFKKNKIVGAKNFKNPKKWDQNLVNDYMIGFDFLIIKGWINWNTSGMALKIENHKKEKKMNKTDVMIYEKVTSKLIDGCRVNKRMSEEDMIVEIYKTTKEICGDKKTRYLFKVDKDYLGDTISEINERLKNAITSR